MLKDLFFKDSTLFENFINQLFCPVIYVAPTGIVEIANHFAAKIFQLDLNKLIGDSLYEICQKRNHSLASLLKVNPRSPSFLEETYITPEMKYFILWNLLPVYSFDESLDGYFLIGQNKDTHDELKRRIFFYEDILSKLPTNVYWKDKNSVYLGCNDRLAQVMGLPSREAINGMTDFDFAWGKEAAESFVAFDKKVMESKIPLTTEDTFKEANGKVVTVLTNKTPLKNEAGEAIGVLAISVDITERKHLEEELIETKAREERFKAMSALGGMIAHELRTPLASLKMSAISIHRYLPQLLQAYEISAAAGQIDEPIRKDHLKGLKRALSDIDHCIDYAQSTITMILAGFQHISSTGLVHTQPFSLAEIVQKAIDQYPFHPGQEGCINIKSIDEIMTIGEEQILVYVLHNLIKNALQAIDAAGKGIITLEAQRKNNTVELIFTDTAKGIPLEYLSQIFEAFYTTKEKASGSIGLGLYFCKMALKRIGAEISCESELGQYTRFKITLLVWDKH